MGKYSKYTIKEKCTNVDWKSIPEKKKKSKVDSCYSL